MKTCLILPSEIQKAIKLGTYVMACAGIRQKSEVVHWSSTVPLHHMKTVTMAIFDLCNHANIKGVTGTLSAGMLHRSDVKNSPGLPLPTCILCMVTISREEERAPAAYAIFS